MSILLQEGVVQFLGPCVIRAFGHLWKEEELTHKLVMALLITSKYGVVEIPLVESSSTEFWFKNKIKLAFYLAFLIQKVQDTQLGLDEINARLVIVEVNQCPRDLLFHVLLLLQFEDMLEGVIAEHDLCVLYVLTTN